MDDLKSQDMDTIGDALSKNQEDGENRESDNEQTAPSSDTSDDSAKAQDKSDDESTPTDEEAKDEDSSTPVLSSVEDKESDHNEANCSVVSEDTSADEPDGVNEHVPDDTAPVQTSLTEEIDAVENSLSAEAVPVESSLPGESDLTEQDLVEEIAPVENSIHEETSQNSLPEEISPSQNSIPEEIPSVESSLPEEPGPVENSLPEDTDPFENSLPETSDVVNNSVPEQDHSAENSLPEENTPIENTHSEDNLSDEGHLPEDDTNVEPANEVSAQQDVVEDPEVPLMTDENQSVSTEEGIEDVLVGGGPVDQDVVENQQIDDDTTNNTVEDVVDNASVSEENIAESDNPNEVDENLEENQSVTAEILGETNEDIENTDQNELGQGIKTSENDEDEKESNSMIEDVVGCEQIISTQSFVNSTPVEHEQYLREAPEEHPPTQFTTNDSSSSSSSSDSEDDDIPPAVPEKDKIDPEYFVESLKQALREREQEKLNESNREIQLEQVKEHPPPQYEYDVDAPPLPPKQKNKSKRSRSFHHHHQRHHYMSMPAVEPWYYDHEPQTVLVPNRVIHFGTLGAPRRPRKRVLKHRSSKGSADTGSRRSLITSPDVRRGLVSLHAPVSLHSKNNQSDTEDKDDLTDLIKRANKTNFKKDRQKDTPVEILYPSYSSNLPPKKDLNSRYAEAFSKVSQIEDDTSSVGVKEEDSKPQVHDPEESQRQFQSFSKTSKRGDTPDYFHEVFPSDYTDFDSYSDHTDDEKNGPLLRDISPYDTVADDPTDQEVYNSYNLNSIVCQDYQICTSLPYPGGTYPRRVLAQPVRRGSDNWNNGFVELQKVRAIPLTDPASGFHRRYPTMDRSKDGSLTRQSLPPEHTREEFRTVVVTPTGSSTVEDKPGAGEVRLQIGEGVNPENVRINVVPTNDPKVINLKISTGADEFHQTPSPTLPDKSSVVVLNSLLNNTEEVHSSTPVTEQTEPTNQTVESNPEIIVQPLVAVEAVTHREPVETVEENEDKMRVVEVTPHTQIITPQREILVQNQSTIGTQLHEEHMKQQQHQQLLILEQIKILQQTQQLQLEQHRQQLSSQQQPPQQTYPVIYNQPPSFVEATTQPTAPHPELVATSSQRKQDNQKTIKLDDHSKTMTIYIDPLRRKRSAKTLERKRTTSEQAVQTVNCEIESTLLESTNEKGLVHAGDSGIDLTNYEQKKSQISSSDTDSSSDANEDGVIRGSAPNRTAGLKEDFIEWNQQKFLHPRTPYYVIVYIMSTINLIFLIAGIALCGLCLYGVLNLLTNDGFRSLEPIVIDPMFTIGVAGIITLVISSVGFGGFSRGNTCLLKLFGSLLMILCILFISGGICFWVFKEDTKKFAIESLQYNIANYNMTSRTMPSFTMDLMQETMQCCGVERYSEWNTHPDFKCESPQFNCTYPPSCCVGKPELCLDTIGSFSTDPCIDTAAQRIDTNLGIMAGCWIGVIGLIIINFVCIHFLIREISYVEAVELYILSHGLGLHIPDFGPSAPAGDVPAPPSNENNRKKKKKNKKNKYYVNEAYN